MKNLYEYFIAFTVIGCIGFISLVKDPVAAVPMIPGVIAVCNSLIACINSKSLSSSPPPQPKQQGIYSLKKPLRLRRRKPKSKSN